MCQQLPCSCLAHQACRVRGKDNAFSSSWQALSTSSSSGTAQASVPKCCNMYAASIMAAGPTMPPCMCNCQPTAAHRWTWGACSYRCILLLAVSVLSEQLCRLWAPCSAKRREGTQLSEVSDVIALIGCMHLIQCVLWIQQSHMLHQKGCTCAQCRWYVFMPGLV